MRYYICDERETWEVPETSYDVWHNTVASKFKLPDYRIVTGEFIYAVESMYKGAIDKDEAVLPFILILFIDEVVIDSEGLNQRSLSEDAEYFATFDEYQKRYYELKKKWESSI